MLGLVGPQSFNSVTKIGGSTAAYIGTINSYAARIQINTAQTWLIRGMARTFYTLGVVHCHFSNPPKASRLAAGINSLHMFYSLINGLYCPWQGGTGPVN